MPQRPFLKKKKKLIFVALFLSIFAILVKVGLRIEDLILKILNTPKNYDPSEFIIDENNLKNTFKIYNIKLFTNLYSLF